MDTSKKMSDDATGVAVVVSVRVKNTSNRRILLNSYNFDLYDEKRKSLYFRWFYLDHAQVGMDLILGRRLLRL